MREVPLSKGMVALVDDEDYPLVCVWKWCARADTNTFYAHSNSCYRYGGIALMHRLILGPTEGLVIDHIDGNGLNNQKSNLRAVTEDINARNRKVMSNSISGIPGVYWDSSKSRWRAQVYLNGRLVFCRRFKTKEEAVAAHDEKYAELFGTGWRWEHE